jgi:hypothetical protein
VVIGGVANTEVVAHLLDVRLGVTERGLE